MSVIAGIRRLLARLFALLSADGTDDEGQSDEPPEEDEPEDEQPEPDEPEPDEPTEPEPEEPDPEPDCAAAEVTAPDDAPVIRVNVFWNEDRGTAAETVVPYLQYALEWGWGDEYHVDVRLMYSVPDDIDSGDDWAGYITEELPSADVAKDCNLLVGGNLDGLGGGKSAVRSAPREFASDPPDEDFPIDLNCIHPEGRHRIEALNALVHEVGHTLGLDHEHGGRRGGAITPMQTTYQQGSLWTVHWHEDALAEPLDIQ